MMIKAISIHLHNHLTDILCVVQPAFYVSSRKVSFGDPEAAIDVLLIQYVEHKNQPFSPDKIIAEIFLCPTYAELHKQTRRPRRAIEGPVIPYEEPNFVQQIEEEVLAITKHWAMTESEQA